MNLIIAGLWAAAGILLIASAVLSVASAFIGRKNKRSLQSALLNGALSPNQVRTLINRGQSFQRPRLAGKATDSQLYRKHEDERARSNASDDTGMSNATLAAVEIEAFASSFDASPSVDSSSSSDFAGSGGDFGGGGSSGDW